MTTSKLERAVLAGGCFWGMQDLIRKLPGVVDTRVGYTGGDVPNATYRNHGAHAEAIEIEFDPKRISYRDLLESSSRFTIRPRLTGKAMISGRPTARRSSTPRKRSATRRSGRSRLSTP